MSKFVECRICEHYDKKDKRCKFDGHKVKATPHGWECVEFKRRVK